jgi:hypothetical protein
MKYMFIVARGLKIYNIFYNSLQIRVTIEMRINPIKMSISVFSSTHKYHSFSLSIQKDVNKHMNTSCLLTSYQLTHRITFNRL